jgi:outer membrane receptor protein involved in Fe transport
VAARLAHAARRRSYTSSNFFFSPENTQLQPPSYDVVNFRLSYDLNDDHSQIGLRIKNLTDSA